MTRLSDTINNLGLEAEQSLDGRWIKLRGERCAVYVVEGAWNSGYFTWCDHPQERAVQYFRAPEEAIHAGLQRAAESTGAGEHGGECQEPPDGSGES